MNILRSRILSLMFTGTLLFFGTACSAGGGDDKSDDQKMTVAFYNVENLFDLEDDPHKNDNDFLPEGSYKWTQEHYDVKLENLSTVIEKLGDEDGPEILGICEIENKFVVEALTQTEKLKAKNYGVAHVESADQRGIDCALIYKKEWFTPTHVEGLRPEFPENPDIKTRDILMVQGKLKNGERITVYVNHWPSRWGGAEESAWKRERVAEVLKTSVDALLATNPNEQIIIIGDFNDEPADKSVKEVLDAGQGNSGDDGEGLFNPWFDIKEETGVGTLKYRQWWNLFDQVIMSHALLDGAAKYAPGSAAIYNPEWMQVEEGDYKDAPKRSHIRRVFYEDGYSDHFPVYVHLILE